ncbi:hypothetical protein [Thermoactinospora rubra]|uniref:hypothetical protein n=1 Tax=Thermoactinospora rubra TaxID=1088767 RepID=UPI000A118F27|nr:hypothetical protein [Thermoactinospora rubra]
MNATEWPVYSPFAKEHFGHGVEVGKAEEAARLLLRILKARHLDVPEDLKTRITSCTDLEQLETLVTRAVLVRSAEEMIPRLSKRWRWEGRPRVLGDRGRDAEDAPAEGRSRAFFTASRGS